MGGAHTVLSTPDPDEREVTPLCTLWSREHTETLPCPERRTPPGVRGEGVQVLGPTPESLELNLVDPKKTRTKQEW